MGPGHVPRISVCCLEPVPSQRAWRPKDLENRGGCEGEEVTGRSREWDVSIGLACVAVLALCCEL